jgi:predicted ATPase
MPARRRAGRGRLPLPLTRFIGYERERTECAALLQTLRLLTITGIGGAGKTRLAIEIAREVEASYADGVDFIDLANLADPDRVAAFVASSLHLREEPAQTHKEALARHLALEDCLLVFDNCEHLIAECAELVEHLLLNAPKLRILATSREALGVSGERIVAMRSMRVPAKAERNALMKYEAVELFVNLAGNSSPDFAVSEANAEAVVDICRRLDGIPLALEFAAARVKVMSVEQIRAKLDDRFRLLAGNAKAMSRHQTLFATLQWSYEHLTLAEQSMLRSLSVFVGGWSLAGAAAVADVADELEAADLLGRLVDKSLVVTDRSVSGEPRHRLLETVRQFAQDRLSENGFSEATRDRHLSYFRHFAEKTGPLLSTRQHGRAVVSLDVELTNLLAAQAWCEHAPDGPSEGLALANSIRRFWLSKGLYAQGRRFVQDALGRGSADENLALRGWANFALGQVNYYTGQLEECCKACELSIRIGRNLNNPRLLMHSLDMLCGALTRQGDFVRAQGCAEEAVARSRSLGEGLGMTLTGLGLLERAQGRFELAIPPLQEASNLFRESGDMPNVANACRNLASVLMHTGDLDGARSLLIESLEITMQSGTNNFHEQNIGFTARLAAACGDWAMAARLQGALDAQCERVGVVSVAAESYMSTLMNAPALQLGEAAYRSAYESGRALDLDEALREIRSWLSRARRAQEEAETRSA